jgi:polar amino acid transport system substrate-binding protein
MSFRPKGWPQVKRRTFLATCAAVAASPLLGSTRPDQQLKFVYAHDYAPFSWLDQEGKLRGILVDTLTEAWSNRMGLSLEHQGLPWSRAQMLVRQQRADAFCTAVTPQRLAYTRVSEIPVIEEPVKIITHTGHPKIQQLREIRDIEDLKPFRIASYLGNGWTQLHFSGYQVENTRSLVHALRMVAGGHADVVVDMHTAVSFAMMQAGLQSQLMFLEPILDQVSFHTMIRKTSPFAKLIPELDRHIKQMRIDGTTSAIRDQYLLG